MLVIYQIRNLANNNRYVGSSRNVQQRFSAHKKTLNNNTHHCIGLQRPWNNESYNVTKTTIATLLKNKSWYDENYIP